MSIISSKEIYSDTQISHDVKSAGKGAVDLVSGALKFAFNDISFNYGNPKISVSHCYDSANASDQNRTYEGEKIFDYKHYGNGWKLNIDCRVCQSSDDERKKLYYVDAEGRLNVLYKYRGNIGYLKRRFINSSYIYVNKENPVGGFYLGSDGRFVKYDENDNFEYYSLIGGVFRLTEIKNNEGKTLEIKYSGTKISRVITDKDNSYERSVSFIYDETTGLLTSMSDSAGRTCSYTYDSEKNLIAVSSNNASGCKAVFTYDSNKRMTSAESDIKYKVDYDYNTSGKLIGISDYRYYKEISASGTVATTNPTPNKNGYEFLNKTNINYIYSANMANQTPITSVKLPTGVKNIYHFDELQSENGFYCYLSYENDKNKSYGAPKNLIACKSDLYGMVKCNVNNNLLRNSNFGTVNSSNGNVADWNIIDNNHRPMDNANNYLVDTFFINGQYSFHMSGGPQNGATTLQQAIWSLPSSGYYSFVAWIRKEGVAFGDSVELKLSYYNSEDKTYTEAAKWSCMAERLGWQCISCNVYLNVPTFTGNDFLLFELSFTHSKGDIYVDSVYFSKCRDEHVKEYTSEFGIIGLSSAGYGTMYKLEDLEPTGFPSNMRVSVTDLIDALITSKGINPANVGLKIKETNKEYKLNNVEILPCAVTYEKSIHGVVKSECDAKKRVTKQTFYNFGENYGFPAEITYDNKGRQIKTKDYRGNIKETVYDVDGIKKKRRSLAYKEGNEGSYKRYITQTELTDDLGAVRTEFDVNRKATVYDYKPQDDFPEFTEDKLYKVTVPNGTEYKNSYDYEHLPQSLSAAGEKTEYVYSLGLPVTVKVNESDIYEFTYDGCGNIIKVEQNGKVLSETEYYQKANYSDASSRNYVKTKDANGTVITYLDEYGRESNSFRQNPDGTTVLLTSSKYNVYGDLTQYKDNSGAQSYLWEFDNVSSDLQKVSVSSDEFDYSNTVTCKNYKPLKSTKTINDDYTVVTDYEYEKYYDRGEYPDKRIVKMSNTVGSDKFNIDYNFDYLDRLNLTEITVNGTKHMLEEFEYFGLESSLPLGNSSKSTPSGMILSCSDENSLSEMYYYDDNGNLTLVTRMAQDNNRYKYDALDRLIREDNRDFGKTYLYEYDEKNNIKHRIEIPFTLADEIDCQKTKTAGFFVGDNTFCGEPYAEKSIDGVQIFNNDGTECGTFPKLTYDKNNVPTSDYNSDGFMVKNGDAQYEWKDGKLSKVTKGSRVLQYEYDSRGYRRTIKDGEANGEYFYDENNNLLFEKQKLGDVEFKNYYIYDLTGLRGFTIKYKVGSTEKSGTFYYLKDTQNNIRLIVDSQGNKVVEYNYTAWGETKAELSEYNRNGITAEMVCNANPFTYRGYYYDRTLDLYYLKSRYYDYKQCRFISPDNVSYLDPQTLGGMNLYAYCLNNPVMGYDPEGTSWSSFWSGVGDWFRSAGEWVNDNIVQPTATFFKENWDVIAAGVALGFAVGIGVASVISDPTKAIGAGFGAFYGGIAGMFNSYANGESLLQGLFSGALIGGLGGANGFAGALAAFGCSLINDRINGKKADWDSVGKALTAGATAGAFAGMGNGLSGFMTKGSKELALMLGANGLSSFGFTVFNILADVFVNFLRG